MNSGKPTIDVLLATYNGARFLEEQLDSLFRQTFQNFRLLVRDDGSTDSTLEIVERYRSQYPNRIFITGNLTRQGACRTFSLLAEESDAPYVAFCDQDDIWRSDKLALSLAAINESETRHSSDLPILVFSDMEIVDEYGRVMARSLWKQAHVRPDRATLGAMLVQNLVSGCTTLANRSVLQKGCPIPNDASMHDAWLGLAAAAFGVLRPLPEATVRYRQHGNNAIGAGSGWRFGDLLQRLRRDPQFTDRIEASRQQSNAFAGRYAHALSPQQKLVFEAWSASQTLPAFVRHWTLHRNGLRGTSFLNHVGFLARV